MADEHDTDTDADPAPVETRTDTGTVVQLRARIDELETATRRRLADLEARGVDPAPAAAPFTPLQVYGALLARAHGIPIETRELADMVADIGTGDASGLTPDYYWAAGLQQNVDRRRPLFAHAGTAQFPTYGNALVSGKVTQDAIATTGVAQKDPVPSQTIIVDPITFPVEWHKTAIDIAIELAEQSNPDALTVAANSMLRAYARACEVDALAKAEALATPTGAALDLTDYGTLVGQLIATGAAIEDATGAFGDRLAVSTADFGTILGMTDGSGRRILATTGAQNADGSAGLAAAEVNIGGITIFRSYAVADGQALMYNTETLRVGERSPIQVAATNVEKMGYDRGYIGATVVAAWDEGLMSFTV